MFLNSVYSKRIRLSIFLIILPLLCLPGQVAAQLSVGASDGTNTFVIPQIDAEPRIDGVADEDAWSQAALITNFHQYAPIEYSEPTQKTEVRLFYSEDALYITARMWETDVDLVNARILRQGQSLQNDDLIAIILDPYLDRRSGYRFEVNANGVRWEGLYQNITSIEGSWDGIWQANASQDEEGWTAEIRIPFQTISFNPDSDSWGINFRRAIRRNNESIAWVSRNRQVNPSVAGTMSGMTGLRQGLGLDVVPSFTMVEQRVFGPLGFTTENFEPSIDIFYKVTPQLNAALTVNTDFSATEVDNRQVNLTRFSLFFPEKRDFFIRDADIFEFGLIGTGGASRTEGGGRSGNPVIPRSAGQNARPFFSRKIGLSATGAPVDIKVGAKLSGRIGDWNLGALIVSQDEDVAGGVDAKEIFVGRAVLNILSESQLGVIVTDGDPQSNLNNTLLGVDFRYRNSRLPGGKILQGVAWYQQSDSESVSGDDASYGFGISSPNNQGWRGAYSYKRVEENFNPAVGFVNQTDVESHALDFGYRYFFRPGGYMRSIYTGFDGYRAGILETGKLDSEIFDFRISANTNTGTALFSRILVAREVLIEDFIINRSSNGLNDVVIPEGDYSFTGGQTGIELGGNKPITGSIILSWGDFYEGNHFQRMANLNWRPTRNFSFGINYRENEIHLPQGNFTVRQTTLNTEIAFSSTLSWSNLAQYDNVSEALGFNSRLHWIPEAGRQVFLVFNYGLIDLDKDNKFVSTNSDISLKFNYTYRF